jgi:dihydrodipicolinate synthase/N-acetylneuraminate lyase
LRGDRLRSRLRHYRARGTLDRFMELPRATGDGAHPSTSDLLASVRPGRKITGMAAVLLPFGADGVVDWASFERLLGRTVAAGLRPAVNMDTGYVQLLDGATRQGVLERARDLASDGFVAGAEVSDAPGDGFDAKAYQREIERIEAHGGLPIVFPSYGLSALAPDAWVDAHRTLGDGCDGFLAFELGEMFVPYGKIQPLSAYRGLVEIERCRGAKHSSLSRDLEWQRLAVRDETRPDFMVLTGNDLAIDLVMYGSDYLLGLASFAPDLFARRDAMWASEDPAFFELNDGLQALGAFAFREPVPAYKHDAAMFLHARGWVEHPAPHPAAPVRPASDLDVLLRLAERLGVRGT